MKITVALDSFKGSLSSLMAGDAVKAGCLLADPAAKVSVSPIADGGEGTAQALALGMGGEMISVSVTGPLGNPVTAEYGYIPETKTAVLEMASAAGITLVSPEQRNPLHTTTFGVGELILHAAKEKGCRQFVVGIGGSATNDGGVGMLSALGIAFLDKNGKPIARGAEGLSSLDRIDIVGLAPEIADARFFVACDVTNPLCGEKGCSAVFGPQKGATPDTVRTMDADLSRYAALTQAVTGKDAQNAAGAGAAGGLGFAFLSYLNAELKSGISLVIEQTGLEEKIKDADLVITGEGRLDGQSVMGKVPVGIATVAKKYKKPVLAFSGCIAPDARLCNGYGIDAFFPILPAPCTLEDAMEPNNAYQNLKNTAEQALRLFLAAKG
ncbi:MAG: glycerate kinase [Ruminococcaceae bacterium]|nr:glycerate kinase [Oscillospiraceae bacterium]